MGKTNAKRKTYKGIKFRSGLEVEVAKTLTRLKIKWKYENIKLKYKQKITHRKPVCGNCGGRDILEEKEYAPDFVLVDSGKLLEVKGNFEMLNRKKMLSVLQWNCVDLVMVFQDPNKKISKKSKKTYGSWCKEKGIEWIRYEDLVKYLKK